MDKPKNPVKWLNEHWNFLQVFSFFGRSLTHLTASTLWFQCIENCQRLQRFHQILSSSAFSNDSQVEQQSQNTNTNTNTNTESMVYGTSKQPDTERITDSIIINFWSSHICEQVKSQEIFWNCLLVRRGGVLVCAHTTKRVWRNKLTNKQTKTTIRQRSK